VTYIAPKSQERIGALEVNYSTSWMQNKERRWLFQSR